MSSYRGYRTVRSYQMGRAPAILSLVVAAVLVPVLLVVGVVMSALLLLIGAGALSVVVALLLVAGWRQKLSRNRRPEKQQTVEADYRVIED